MTRSVEVSAASLHQLREMRREKPALRAAIDAEIEGRHRENLGLQRPLIPDERSVLIHLMRALRQFGRPSSYPPEVRAAWDQCESVLGEKAAIAIHLEQPL